MEGQGQGGATATPSTTATPGQADGANTPQGAAPSQEGNAAKEAAAEAKRRLKIDDQEVDEDEVVKIYKQRKSHQQAANKELQEGLKAKRQAEEFVAMMKDKGKLFEVIQKLGHNPRSLAEEYLAQALEDEMMDPKEKQMREITNRLKTYEEREAQAKKEAEQKQLEAEKKHFADKYSAEFVEALKETGLPPTKVMVAEMAKYVAHSAKIKMPITAIEAARLVQQDEENRVKHRLQNADAEAIIKILGEEGLQKVRAFDTSRLKDPNAGLRTPTEQGEVRQKRDPSQRMTPQQWRKFNFGR